jgi:hypothetical protein
LERMRATVKVTGLEADRLAFSARRLESSVRWSQLQLGDRKRLACAAAELDPRGNAVAAFFLHASGESAEARQRLALARAAGAAEDRGAKALAELQALIGY